MKNTTHLRLSFLTNLLVLLALVSGMFLSTQPATAATTITVNSTSDQINSSDNLCTLREAIIAANRDAVSGRLARECQAGSGADTIIIPAGVYNLTRTDNGREDASATGDLDITSNVTLEAKGGSVLIQGISGFTDRIFHILRGTVSLSGLTIKGGKVTGDGGGIYTAGNLSMENVTLSGNTASGNGGGLYHAGGSTTLTYVTIANNTSASQLASVQPRSGSTLTLKATLLASPANVLNCNANLVSAGYNLSSDNSCRNVFNQSTDQNEVDPMIGPLQENNNSTYTHPLQAGSPAIDKIPVGNELCPVSPSKTDQRGVTRPQGGGCDIGAHESEVMTQSGPIYTVYTTADPGDSLCTLTGCSLRAAIQAANNHPNRTTPNGTIPDEIHFAIPGSIIPVIQVSGAALPAITDPLIIDGTTQPGGQVVLDGSIAGTGVSGLTITAGNSTVRGLILRNFTGSGITILSGLNNRIEGNEIYANALLPVDLGGDGPTPNDAGDLDQGANNLQNYPILLSASLADGTVTGRLNSQPGADFRLDFFASQSCSALGSGQGEMFLGSSIITTDVNGNWIGDVTLNFTGQEDFITATATDPDGNTSELSPCVSVSGGNDSWPNALLLTSNPAAASQSLDRPGQSRWYKFQVQPGSKVVVTLTGLSANYDLTLYKDIRAAFASVGSTVDLARLGAEFAPDAFSPDAFSPDAFSPDAFSPDAFSPDAFSPDAFSPDAFSPDAFSPDAFSPDAFSPDAFSPDAFSPDAFSPDAFSPDAFSPDAFSPDAFSPDAFSSAQTRSLIGISAFEGTASEGLRVNTWDNSGEFYVRVRGRNGAFNPAAPFRLDVTLPPGDCGELQPLSTNNMPVGQAGNYRTIILTDLVRISDDLNERATLQGKLAAFAALPEVAGVMVDVGTDPRVAAANDQADAHLDCPEAKNLVARAIKDIVNAFWQKNSLEYVVIVGGDAVIPFFRHPDHALLANEKNYVPPVLNNEGSQASLRLGYVLSQDSYGSKVEVTLKDDRLPVPELAVGRLVETVPEVIGMLDAYPAATAGLVATPASALVTGYDFLADGAGAVQAELAAGLGNEPDTLITPRGISPLDPSAWTADQLRAQLLGQRHDLVFLAGHFSDASALAADYRTRLLSSEVVSSTVDLTNALIFSAGCHAGYSLVDPDAVPRVTREPDWAQAFARKRATLIAGTGYQYGDTDFIEYSERLYRNFARQLRAGSGPVAIGKALSAAKQAYLADTPQLRGIHEKVLLESTLFGLPMLRVNLPQGRGTPPVQPSIISATQGYGQNPGAALGLSFANLGLDTALDPQNPITVQLTDPADQSTIEAKYWAGANGVVARPSEPVLPLKVLNVSFPGTILRGVGFRGGTYTDESSIIPLLGAATTEIRGVHTPFQSDVFYPVGLASVNYFDMLSSLGGDTTRLMLTPAQFKSTATGAVDGTMRLFGHVDLRLYYSNNTETYTDTSDTPSTPALAAAPAIVRVSASASDSQVAFQASVVGNPAAGIQEVWVTYTAEQGDLFGKWQSLDLTQSPEDSTLWVGNIDLSGSTSNPEALRFMVQAANGVGLVSMVTNQGRYYRPGSEAVPTLPTALTLEGPDQGAYGEQARFSAVLSSNGTPLSGQPLFFGLGPLRRVAFTNNDGRAMVDLPLLGLVTETNVQVSFLGDENYLPFSVSETFKINKQNTNLSLSPNPAGGFVNDPNLLVGTLTDATGRPLLEKTVIFVIKGSAGSASVPSITNLTGQAVLGNLSLPPGSYIVNAYFGQEVTLDDGSTTLDLRDERYESSSDSGALTICTAPNLSLPNIWPPDNTFKAVSLTGVNDANGNPMTISITSIFQDEPVGTGQHSPDGSGIGTNTAQLRAERDGTGDGRVYHIGFTAAGVGGAICSAVVRVGVVDNQGTALDPIDGGPLYDSTVPGN